MSAIQFEVRRMHAAILSRIASANRDLVVLQEQCTHPDAIKKHRSNTGNYDPSSDRYWTEFSCADCGKSWSQEGSL